MKVQNLGFKINNKRDSKTHNEKRNHKDALERRASVDFKLRKQKLIIRTLDVYI